MFYNRILAVALRVAVSALTSVALVGSTVGCSSLRPVTGAPQVGQMTKVSFGQETPIDVIKGKGQPDTLHLTSMRAIEGRVVQVSGDTLQMTVANTNPTNNRALRQRALIPLSSTTKLEHRKFSGIKTTFLILGMLLLVTASGGMDIEMGGGGGFGM